MSDYLSEVASDLGLDLDDLRKALRMSRREVKHARIPKPTGGYRTLQIPPRPAKLVQYWTITNVLREAGLSTAATAFFKRACIYENARAHRYRTYFLRVDIKDFFASITKNDFFAHLRSLQLNEAGFRLANSEGDAELELALFTPEGVCGIGYPISPYVSNIVMRDFDEWLLNWLRENRHRYGISCYTRYADDMVISTDKKGFSAEILGEIEKKLRYMGSPRLRVNRSKVKFGNRRAGSAQVTGLRITPDSRITLHRGYKDHVRLLLSLSYKGRLDSKERHSLKGHLNFCRAADPSFYTKMKEKYFHTIAVLFSE